MEKQGNQKVTDPTRTIEGLLSSLNSEVAHLRTDFERREEKSDQNRAVLHKRLNDLVDRVGSMEGTIKVVVEDLAVVKPVTAEWLRMKTMGKGYLIGAAVSGSGLTLFFQDHIINFFRSFKGG